MCTISHIACFPVAELCSISQIACIPVAGQCVHDPGPEAAPRAAAAEGEPGAVHHLPAAGGAEEDPPAAAVRPDATPSLPRRQQWCVFFKPRSFQ